jgi:hypothetical protein
LTLQIVPAERQLQALEGELELQDVFMSGRLGPAGFYVTSTCRCRDDSLAMISMDFQP